jgi:hypothetical protein
MVQRLREEGILKEIDVIVRDSVVLRASKPNRRGIHCKPNNNWPCIFFIERITYLYLILDRSCGLNKFLRTLQYP